MNYFRSAWLGGDEEKYGKLDEELLTNTHKLTRATLNVQEFQPVLLRAALQRKTSDT